MWNGNRVSLVLMTYAERDSIRAVIEGFVATGVVDEVVVVDNNAQAGTREEVAPTPARLVSEPKQGYGHAIRRGLVEATGDLIGLAENMTVGGSHAGAEIMLLTIVSGARFVEVPVNYLPRVGTSSVTGKRLQAIALGLRMIQLVLRFRASAPRRVVRPPPLAVGPPPAGSSKE